MKRGLLTVLALLVLILLAGTLGCGTHNAVEREASAIDDTVLNTAVELYIKQKTVTDETDEFTVSYVNKTDTDYTYDASEHLETLLDGAWYTVPDTQDAVAAVLNTLPANGTMEEMFYTEEHYTKLTHGTYRIVKTFYAGDGTAVIAGASFDIR